MRRENATKERPTVARTTVPTAKASGAAGPAAWAARETLNAMAMVGARTASDRDTASTKPSFRANGMRSPYPDPGSPPALPRIGPAQAKTAAQRAGTRDKARRRDNPVRHADRRRPGARSEAAFPSSFHEWAANSRGVTAAVRVTGCEILVSP